MHKFILTFIAILTLLGMPFIVSADQSQNNESNNLGLYGFNLNLSLGQAVNLAQEKGYEIQLLETDYNSNIIKLINRFIQSKNIDVSIRRDKNLSSSFSKHDELSKILQDVFYKIKYYPDLTGIINIAQMNFILRDKCIITLSFYINSDTDSINFNDLYPYSIFIHFFNRNSEYYKAAQNIFEQRADKKEEKSRLKLYIKGDAICEDDTDTSNYDFLIYSSTRIGEMINIIGSYFNKEKEKKNQEKQNQLQQLQEGM